jgi:hypothetical protein
MDNNISASNYLAMDITLMRTGYSYEDMNDLFSEPFNTEYSTKIGFQWYPSVVGLHMIDFNLAFKFILTGAATVLVSKITSDLYEWSKVALRKVLSPKTDFNESRINLSFKDINVKIYINSFEYIVTIMENMEKVFEYIEENRSEKDRIKFEAEDIVEFIKNEKES